MDEEFDIDKEIDSIKAAMENIKATFAELQGRLKFLEALKSGGYKITKAQSGEDEEK